jgi:hypothetical protein
MCGATVSAQIPVKTIRTTGDDESFAAIDRRALFAPNPPGRKRSIIESDDEGATVDAQGLETAKSAVSVPLMDCPVMSRSAVPVLLTFTASDFSMPGGDTPKSTAGGSTVILGAAFMTPAPVRATVSSGDVGSLARILRKAALEAEEDGVKRRVIESDEAGSIAEPDP